ncbi:MAG: c-type cytochrome [Flavobacteriales bacterium]
MNLYLSRKLKTKELTLGLSFLFFMLISFSTTAQLDGKALFMQNCAACHKPLKNGTGPMLQGARAKWEAAGDNIYKWIKNPAAQIAAGVPSAMAIKDYDASMMPGQAVNNEEIDAILKYVDEYTPPVAPTLAPTATEGGGSEQNNSWLMWLIIGGILSMLIVALWGVRKQLYYAAKEKEEGVEIEEEESFGSEVKSWIGRNMKFVSVLGFVLTCIVVYYGAEQLYKVGLVPEGYNPDQPVAFSHKIHAGTNEIDCQYCHNSAAKSKSAGIPTVNVCMNCHKAIGEASSGEKGTAEIAKIHKAAGWDHENRKYTGKTEPIKWVKVHNMPDHVYFNHSQHVTVGGIECENCHGDVKTYTTGKISGTETINNLDLPGKKLVKLSKPLLTMGWCIECHSTAEVSTKDNKYYDEIHDRLKKDKELYKSVMEDGKVKVKEFGGWECSKCHY